MDPQLPFAKYKSPICVKVAFLLIGNTINTILDRVSVQCSGYM